MALKAACRRQDTDEVVNIDATGLHYRDLNDIIHKAAAEGTRVIEVHNVNGQRYIGAGLRADITIRIHGTAGNDLGVFMDGPTIEVFGNAQDIVANTLNNGRIIVRGAAGQIAGLSMRGGRLYVAGSVGYRSGIHMKGYKDLIPVIIIGGHAGAFLGEYMAGGRLYVLGLSEPSACPTANEPSLVPIPTRCRSMVGMYTGTGMHGGVMYIRGEVDPFLLGKEVIVSSPEDDDMETISADIEDYAACLGLDAKEILSAPFQKLAPKSHRPYGKNYAY